MRKLSVIVPAFNEIKTIEHVIDRVGSAPLPEGVELEIVVIDDASTELMMGSGDKVMLMLGDAFFESSEDDATEFCEAEVEKYQAVVDKLEEEESEILEEQEKLKKILYTRFGKSINLEDS